MSWNELADWWIDEVADDPAYEEVVTPLLVEILQPVRDFLYVDLGCGEGRVMRQIRSLGARALGVELSRELAGRSASVAPTVIGRLPDLGFMAPDSVDGAYSVLVIEHLETIPSFFEAVARVVRPGGTLAVVANHPIWTAPDSTPITDGIDGEVLWRSGDYFGVGYTDEPAGNDSKIRFHHRSMASLLNTAADAGWSLEAMIEQPHHEFEEQSGIPRLLACRWRLVP